jgi:hypothetical protein
LPVEETYRRGFAAEAKQKFYSKNTAHGMFYVAHEIRYQRQDYAAFVRDTLSPSTVERKEIEINENSMEYTWQVGNRIIQGTRQSGFTFDIFAGLGVGLRYQEFGYKRSNGYREEVFENVPKGRFFIPFRIGFSFGYLFL